MRRDGELNVHSDLRPMYTSQFSNIPPRIPTLPVFRRPGIAQVRVLCVHARFASQ